MRFKQKYLNFEWWSKLPEIDRDWEIQQNCCKKRIIQIRLFSFQDGLKPVQIVYIRYRFIVAFAYEKWDASESALNISSFSFNIGLGFSILDLRSV